METPRDNTEVVRMLKDVQDAIYQSRTPLTISKGNLGIYQQSFNRHSYNLSLGSSVATKLDFSHLEDSTNNQSECNTLKRKLRDTEAELLVSKAKIKDKEGVISLLEPANKKKCLDLQNELETSKRQNEIYQDQIKELKSHIRRLTSDEADAKNRLIENEKQRKQEGDNKERQIASLKIECRKLKSEIVEAKSEKAECVRKLNSQIASLELEVTSLRHEVERSKEYIQMLEKQVKELDSKSTLASQLQKELNNADIKIKNLESQLEADKEASLVARTMQSELKLLPELRVENQQLKEELSEHKENNIYLLKENIWSLQEKLTQAEKKSVLVTKIQAENEQMKEKISEWESLQDDKEQSRYKSPSSFSRRLSEYQKNETILTDKVAKLTWHCRNLDVTMNKLELTVAEQKKENTKMKRMILSLKSKLKLCEKKIYFLTKERECSRKCMDSLISAASETGSTTVDSYLQYIKTLEESLEDYRDMLTKTEEEVKDLEQQLEDNVKGSTEYVDNSAEIKKLREENADLLLKLDEVQLEKILLEEQLSKAKEEQLSKAKEVVAPADKSFKVVHMKCNPLDDAIQQRIAEHSRLRSENDRLRKRIKVLEEEGARAENVTLKVQKKLVEEGTSETIENLNKRLVEAEKRCEILKESFHKTSQSLREACYMMTGYKIEMVNKTFKLYHMYADSPDDYLMFQLSDEGTLSLVENDYTMNLKDRIETYLLRYDSIPAFLATLTMDLFGHQTCIILDKDSMYS